MTAPKIKALDRLEDLPTCAAPVLAQTSWGAFLLLTDWTSPTPAAFLVTSDLLPEVRRALDLRPAQKEVEA